MKSFRTPFTDTQAWSCSRPWHCSPDTTFGKSTHISMISNSVTHLRSNTNSVWQTPYGVTILATPRNSNDSCQPCEQPLFTEPSNSYTNILHLHKRSMPQTKENFHLQDTGRLAAHLLSARLCYSYGVFSPASGVSLPARTVYYISSGSSQSHQSNACSWPGNISKPSLLVYSPSLAYCLLLWILDVTFPVVNPALLCPPRGRRFLHRKSPCLCSTVPTKRPQTSNQVKACHCGTPRLMLASAF